MQAPPFYKRLLSYLYPVRIRASGSPANPILELYFFKGQYQLATVDAIYSDGDRYRPLLAAYKELGSRLQAVKDVLVLGTGLGSAVRIMNKQGYTPNFTLVDNDKLVLQWALEFMDKETAGPAAVKPVCADAEAFMANNAATYSLVIVDVFKGRVVPQFVTSAQFLSQCRKAVSNGGNLALNYIINNKAEWELVQENFATIFPNHKVIEIDNNRILVATV